MKINIDSIQNIKEIPNIEFNVSQINSIKKEYPVERTDSKTPTFALT